MRSRLFLINSILLEEAEDVVQNVVAARLFSEEEGLDKLAPRLALVGHLADDLDYDAPVRRRLSVNAVDEDLAVLEANRSDLTVNFLETAISTQLSTLLTTNRIQRKTHRSNRREPRLVTCHSMSHLAV
jgi:hypothetical protein